MDHISYSSIPDMVRGSARRFGKRTAFEEHGEAWSFADMEDAMFAAGRAMLAAGVQPGDRVAIWAPNCVHWVIAATGIHAVGGVIVPINTRFRALEATQILVRSEAKLMVTVGTFLNRDYPSMLVAHDATVISRLKMVGLTESPVAEVQPWDEFVAAGAVVDVVEVEQRIAALTPSHLSDLMFTSGTTGEPKAVMSSHGGNLFVAEAMVEALEYTQDDRCLLFQPFFHAGGFKGGWITSMIAGTLTVPDAVYSSKNILKRCIAQNITICKGPPPFFRDLVQEARAEGIRPTSFRLALISSSNIPSDLVQDVREVLGFDFVSTGYGMTESHGTIAIGLSTDAPDSIARSSGRPLRGTEVRIIDAEGRDVPAGEPGEIIFRGPNVMMGYWESDHLTNEALDVDGWMHTGDVGVFTDDGLVAVVDRLKDMYIVGGFNVYPAEVEDIIGSRSDVAEVAVVARPDDRLGEVGVAFVVPTRGAVVDEAELIAWCREQMANFKVPREVRLVDTLPRNATMKVVRFELQEQLTTGVLEG